MTIVIVLFVIVHYIYTYQLVGLLYLAKSFPLSSTLPHCSILKEYDLNTGIVNSSYDSL